MKKIMIVVIVVLVAVAGYFMFVKKSGPVAYQTPTPTVSVVKTAAPTANPTANWKTYTSTRDGVTFRYPSSSTQVSTQYRSDLSGSDADLYFKNYMDPRQWQPISTVKIAGYIANKFSGTICDGGGSGSCGPNVPWTTYIFLYDGHPFQVEFNENVSASVEKEIFATFKFTK